MPSREAVLAIDDQHRGQPLILLVAADVAQFGQGLQRLDEPGRPPAQLLRIRVFQRVLILRAADAIFHREILHRLHEQCDAIDAGQARACSRKMTSCTLTPAFGEGLEIDLNACRC